MGVHQRAAAAAPGNVGGVDNAGQGITVQLMSGGADDAGADGQPQTQRVADGVHRIAGADVRRAHQIQIVESGGGAAGLIGPGDLDYGDVDTGIVVEDPLYLVGFSVEEGGGGLDGIFDGVIVGDGQTVGADEEAAGVGGGDLIVDLLLCLIQAELEGGGEVAVRQLAGGIVLVQQAQSVGGGGSADTEVHQAGEHRCFRSLITEIQRVINGFRQIAHGEDAN